MSVSIAARHAPARRGARRHSATRRLDSSDPAALATADQHGKVDPENSQVLDRASDSPPRSDMTSPAEHLILDDALDAARCLLLAACCLPARPSVRRISAPRRAANHTGTQTDVQASRTVVLRALRASSSRPLARPARMLSTTRVVRDEAAPAAEVSPKISSIVDSVEKLTLLEVSELVSALKVSGAGLGWGRRDAREEIWVSGRGRACGDLAAQSCGRRTDGRRENGRWEMEKQTRPDH